MLRRWFPAVGALALLLGNAGTSSAQFIFLPVGFGNPVFGYGAYNFGGGGWGSYPGGIGMGAFPRGSGAFTGGGPINTGVSTFATNPYYNGYNAALGAQASYLAPSMSYGPSYYAYSSGRPSNGYVAYTPRSSGVASASYSNSEPDMTAQIVVEVPAGAELWFDGHKTSQSGRERVFHTPSLDRGQTYHYTVRARWMDDGQPVDQTQRVQVSAGSRATVFFPRAR